MSLQLTPNPAYLKATHVMLLVGPGFPSLDEQIEQDEKAQKEMERMTKERRVFVSNEEA